MARKKVAYTEENIQEVNEILQKKFIEVNYVPSKITYNNVFKFNKEIADNDNYIRHNGKKFTLYSYDFWCNSYKGEPNLGKKLVDEFKALNQIEHIITDDLSTPAKRIISKVHELKDKPEYLNKYLVKSLKDTDTKLIKLETENTELKDEVSKLKEELRLMQGAIHNIFYNSASSRNSLSNMMSLSKSQDDFAKKLILSTFKSEDELVAMLKQDNQEDEKDIQNLIDINKQRDIKAEKAKKFNLFGK